MTDHDLTSLPQPPSSATVFTKYPERRSDRHQTLVWIADLAINFALSGPAPLQAPALAKADPRGHLPFKDGPRGATATPSPPVSARKACPSARLPFVAQC